MLFDLRGRRRRAVQVTYLMLALLMGGGLVLFGVGGDVSGGLLDAFKGGGGSSGNSALNDSIKKEEERLQTSPRNQVLLQSLVRDYYARRRSPRRPARPSRLTRRTTSARPARTGTATCAQPTSPIH